MSADTLALSLDTISEVIETLRFSAREPVGKNATFARGKGRRLYRTDEATAFRERIRCHAFLARNTSAWPSDPWVPAKVRVTVALYNGRWDAGACDTIVCDSLEGVLYVNDRIVVHGPAELPIMDEGERRAEIVVELLAVRTAAEADKLRVARENRLIAGLKRRQKAKAV